MVIYYVEKAFEPGFVIMTNNLKKANELPKDINWSAEKVSLNTPEMSYNKLAMTPTKYKVIKIGKFGYI